MGAKRKADKTDEMQIEYGSYCDVLHDFVKTIIKINDIALDGESEKELKKRFARVAPAFMLLCGVDGE